MKKIISVLVLCIILSSIFTININVFSESLNVDTNVLFVTDNKQDKNFIENAKEKIKDDEFIKKNKIGKYGFDEIGKKITNISSKTLKNITETNTISDNVDSVFIDYQMFTNPLVIKYAKDQLAAGKIIMFYGRNIDKIAFCKTFDLENTIPKNDVIEKGVPLNELTEVEEPLNCIGVEKESWGNTLITSVDTEYNFYRTVDNLLAQAVHSKKYKVKKPYNDFKKAASKSEIKAFSSIFSTPKTYAAGIDDYPILNTQRKSSNFGGYGCDWYLITDCYLHRVSDQDPQYDYMVLETISELNTAHGVFINTADQFYTKLQGYYSSDQARAGGPGSQGGTTEINVGVYPPSIGFTYIPGSEMSVNSTFSLSDRSFEAYYTDDTFWGSGFATTTIHRTELSYATYAPSSGSTYTRVNIYQKARNLSHHEQYPWAFNPTIYYYDY